ncbi:MAG: S8 family serine peptidase [Pseudomonadota bacterium]
MSVFAYMGEHTNRAARWLPALLLCAPLVQAAGMPDALPPAYAEKAAPALHDKLVRGEIRDVLVLFEDPAIDAELDAYRALRQLQQEDAQARSLRADRYRALRERALADLPAGAVELRRSYRNIPMALLRLRDADALVRLLARGEVAAVYENTRMVPHLAEVLPLVGQSAVNTVMGRTGSGTAIAVLDTGVDYTRSEFGSCSAPGVPAGCRVVAAFDTAPDDGSRDANGHGTWVAGVATAVAPGAGIIAIDVFDGGTAYSSDIIEGIDWAIDNRAVYNIVALNLSLGDGNKYTSTCKSGNPYRQPLFNARNAGILGIVSSGNDGFTDGIANPACTPEAVSVGATYDANVGARTWTAPEPDCTDSSTAADKVACFSNSASFLTLLAPGALTTVTGATVAGTSVASPVVSGAVALLAQAFPADSATTRLGRLTANGVYVTDARNSIVKPRVDVLAAQGAPANDAFAAAAVLTGNAGGTTGWNLNATAEAGEPAHAGTSGGKSVWWQWTPAVSGTASVHTHGSGADTLLAVYTGSSVGALAAVASNDNDGSSGNASGLNFAAVAGTTYRIAVDGKAGAAGALSLAWSLLQAQTISFDPVPDTPVGSVFSLDASASSGLAVGYASQTPAVCTTAGNVVSLVAVGTCTVAADQAGDATYAAAPTVVRSFASTALAQTIAFGPLADRAIDSGAFAVEATASSGLPVQFVSLTGAVCGVSGSTVSLLAVGTCTLSAQQPGNATYAPADPVVQSFSVVAAAAADGDVPLPPWALLLLGAGLLGGIGRKCPGGRRRAAAA